MTSVLIFSGFNMRAVYAFIRTLEKEKLTYAIIASSNEDEIFQTEYAKNVIAVREYKQLVLEDIVTSIQTVQQKTPSNKYFIAPSTEALNRFLLDNRKVLEDMNCIIPLTLQDLYEAISDKKSFGELCVKHHIPIPKEYDLNTVQIPCVAKPKTYVGEVSQQILKPILIMTSEQLKGFYKKYNTKDFYFQEYVEGRSVYLLYYFYDDGSSLKYSQENFIQQSEGRSILAAKSSDFHLSEHSKPYEKLFQGITYRGLVMIEVKVDKNDALMIEANPRFWGPSQLFVDADVNFFNAMLYDYGLLSKKPMPKNNLAKSILYFWNDGESYLEENIEEVAFHNYSKKQFVEELELWEQSNILNRSDTKKIHQALIKGTD